LDAQVLLDVSSGISVSNIEFYNETVDWEFDPFTGAYFDFSAAFFKLNRVRLGVMTQIDFRGYQSGGSSTLSYRRMYLDLMPFATLNIWKGMDFSLAGFYGILLRDDYKGISGKYKSLKHLETVKNRDFGLMTSLMYMYRKIGLKIQYKYGLMNIDNVLFHNINGVSIGDVQHKTRELQVGLVVRLWKSNP